MARGVCENAPVDMFIDSGATTSLVNSSLLDILDKTEYIKPTNKIIVGLANKIVPMKGEIQLEIQFAGVKITHTFIIRENLGESFLIGMDILNKAQIHINIPNRVISTPFGEERFIFEPETLKTVRKIKCKKTLQLLPNTINYVVGELNIKQSNSSYEGIIEPFHKLGMGTGIFVTKSMAYSDGNKVPVQCINVTNDVVTIYRGQLLGFMEPFEKFETVHGARDITDGLNNHHYIKTVTEEAYDASLNIPRFVNDEEHRKNAENVG